MNWKVLVEQFLEGYHIRTTHKDTFYPLQYDDLNVVETFGPNSRITFPYRNIERLRDRPESTWTVDAPGHVSCTTCSRTSCSRRSRTRCSMVAIDPVDVDHTTVTIYSHGHDPRSRPATVGAMPDRRPSGCGQLHRAGLAEDNEMSEGVQRGLRCRRKRFRGVRTARERDRALPRHPGRAAGRELSGITTSAQTR